MKKALIFVMVLTLMTSFAQAQTCATYNEVGSTSDSVYGANNGANDNSPRNFTTVSKTVTDGGNTVTAAFTTNKMIGYRDNILLASNARKFRLYHREAANSVNSTRTESAADQPVPDEFEYTMDLSNIPTDHNARVTLSQHTGGTTGQLKNNEYSTYTISWTGGVGDATVYDEATSTDPNVLYAGGAHTGFDVSEKQIEGLVTGDTVSNGGTFNVYHVASANSNWRIEFPIGVTSVTVNKKAIVIAPAAGGLPTLANGYTIDPAVIPAPDAAYSSGVPTAPSVALLNNQQSGKGVNYPSYGTNWVDDQSKWGVGAKVGETFNEVITLGVELVQCITFTPIEFASIHAENTTAGNEITWATLSEMNNSHFIVERSYDGLNFEPIHQKAGANNSTEKIHYKYVDNTYSTTTNYAYYRIKQVDFDGTTDYSKIVSVTYGKENATSIVPNPVKTGETVTIFSKQIETVNIYNAMGALKQQHQGNKKNSITINTHGLAKGIYLVHINNKINKKLIVN